MFDYNISLNNENVNIKIENNKNEITKSIDEELDEIENYTEQALFYARSNTVNKDYVVTKSNLKEIVNGAILKSKRVLLSNKISIELNDLEKEVFTDSKWATFIINQIIQNSIKYSKKEDKKIQLYAKSNNENIILYIKDNGIGIKKGEIIMLELDKTTFEAEVLQAPGKILVDFYGDGCVPCAALMPHVHGFADVYGDKIKFCALNTTKARRLAISQKILGLPVIAIYENGEMIDSCVKDDATPENVEAMIKKYI